MGTKRTQNRAAVTATARAERLKILESGLPMGDLVVEPGGRGEETKRRILDTSITLFAARGFEACTMRDIAAAVGIKAPAIYNHYTSKEDVLAEAMEHIMGRFFWSLLGPLEEEPVETWLKGIVCSHVSWQLEYPRLSQANDALLNAPNKKKILPPPVYRRVVGVQRSYVDLLSSLIHLSAPRDSEWDVRIAAFGIAAMCDRVVGWYDPKGPLEVSQVADRSWKLVSRMIGASA
ncbi:MAG TPA: TetR/AcrR family transcriptional regulator [Solirubrobacterales bacterium]|nr:TetR/AcrR family transcriptional regulator [Solirubrobacterales bacterium]